MMEMGRGGGHLLTEDSAANRKVKPVPDLNTESAPNQRKWARKDSNLRRHYATRFTVWPSWPLWYAPEMSAHPGRLQQELREGPWASRDGGKNVAAPTCGGKGRTGPGSRLAGSQACGSDRAGPSRRPSQAPVHHHITRHPERAGPVRTPEPGSASQTPSCSPRPGMVVPRSPRPRVAPRPAGSGATS